MFVLNKQATRGGSLGPGRRTRPYEAEWAYYSERVDGGVCNGCNLRPMLVDNLLLQRSIALHTAMALFSVVIIATLAVIIAIYDSEMAHKSYIRINHRTGLW